MQSDGRRKKSLSTDITEDEGEDEDGLTTDSPDNTNEEEDCALGASVTHYDLHGQIVMGLRPAWKHGFTLIEVLCVMAIIAILVSLMLPALAKGLRKAKGIGGHLGGPEGIQMRIGEVVTNYTRYRLAHPTHGKMSRRTFVQELNLSPTAETWLGLRSVEYRPFAASDPIEQPAIIVFGSEGGGNGYQTAVFTIRDLLLP